MADEDSIAEEKSLSFAAEAISLFLPESWRSLLRRGRTALDRSVGITAIIRTRLLIAGNVAATAIPAVTMQGMVVDLRLHQTGRRKHRDGKSYRAETLIQNM
jgi:hypothetical protein